MIEIVHMVYWRKQAKWARKRSGGSCIRLDWVTDHRKATKWTGTGPIKQSFGTGVFSKCDVPWHELEVHTFEVVLQYKSFDSAANFIQGKT